MSMKRVMFLISAFMMIIACQAQSEHMKFMGIPFDTNINSFISQLKVKRFTYYDTVNDVRIMKGKFAGYNDCKIFVYPTPDNEVQLVAINFPEAEQWSILYNNYRKIKEMLIEKYGQPDYCEEKFNSYTQPTNDRSKFHEVMMERCKYSTEFYTNLGMIKVFISSISMRCYVALIYGDKVNTLKSEESAIDDL